MSGTVRPHPAWEGPAIIRRIVELAMAGHGVKTIAETLNTEGMGVPTRWTTGRVHDALHRRAADRFHAMTQRAKVEWVNQFAELPNLDSASSAILGYELPALARSVGLGWSWFAARPLQQREVRRVHDAVRKGMAALKGSKHVHRVTADEIRQQVFRDRRRAGPSVGWGVEPPVGWLLPRHRVRLRLLPSPALGEETSVFATIDAADEVSAIVAALGYFYWRHADRWRECACGCGLTFVIDGKQRFIEGHGELHRSTKHYNKHKDAILQKRRQKRQQSAGEEMKA